MAPPKSVRVSAVLPLAALAILLAILQAARLAWTSDDAYISFRYAENFVRGLGLVYNAGERVEGYSNFLWTLWCALGLRLGFAAEAWANVSSIACFAATVALLAGWSRRVLAARGLGVPLAALLLVFHRDAALYATSGLETSLFTMLLTLGFVLLAVGADSTRALAAAGLAFALAMLTRPDGFVAAAVAGAFVLWTSRRRPAGIVAFVLPLALIVGPYLLWKRGYYGDVLPNTYYAKSGQLAWYSQGVRYVAYFFEKYWVLLLGPPLLLLGLARKRASDEASDLATRSAALAAALAAVWIAYVARVGGDFMYARFLIPATPLLAVLLELGLARLRLAAPVHAAAALGCVLAIALTPYPFDGPWGPHGIANEPRVYTHEERAKARTLGLTMRRQFAGLPVRLAFSGMTAIEIYYSRVPVAIEAETGLTDSFIAHQPLRERGRVGHEKHAPARYLIETRRVHFFLSPTKEIRDTLDRYVPDVPARFGWLNARVLTWDPPVMEELERRGVEIGVARSAPR